MVTWFLLFSPLFREHHAESWVGILLSHAWLFAEPCFFVCFLVYLVVLVFSQLAFYSILLFFADPPFGGFC